MDSNPEEEKKLINKIVKVIAKYNLETVSIFFFEWFKPMVYVMGGLSRIFLAPFFIMGGDEANKLLMTLEKRDNIEMIIKLLEEEINQENE